MLYFDKYAGTFRINPALARKMDQAASGSFDDIFASLIKEYEDSQKAGKLVPGLKPPARPKAPSLTSAFNPQSGKAASVSSHLLNKLLSRYR